MNHSWAAVISSSSHGLFLFSRCLTLLSFTSDPSGSPRIYPSLSPSPLSVLFLLLRFLLRFLLSPAPSLFVQRSNRHTTFLRLPDTYADASVCCVMGVDAAVFLSERERGEACAHTSLWHVHKILTLQDS